MQWSKCVLQNKEKWVNSITVHMYFYISSHYVTIHIAVSYIAALHVTFYISYVTSNFIILQKVHYHILFVNPLKSEGWKFYEEFLECFCKRYIRDKNVTVESIIFIALSVKEILRWKKMEYAHSPPGQIYKNRSNQIGLNKDVLNCQKIINNFFLLF